uniref:Envelope protein n=1 Tax=Crocuta crocuta TaxID=9678 RepID=A0A3G2LIK7_CROCR|nr:envelope protein [Crocuta crocuta]AYN72243.1 envelope protein [Crocuta crocuta]AYN72244.1 envelope protein [Crocuta crocuta]
MEGHKEPQKPAQAQAMLLPIFTALLTVCKSNPSSHLPNPHQPTTAKWVLRGPLTTPRDLGRTVQELTLTGPASITFPTFHLDLCSLAGDHWNTNPKICKGQCVDCNTFGCRSGADCQHQNLRQQTFYVCPGTGNFDTCGGIEHFFCGSWGCETIAPWVKQPSNDLITLVRASNQTSPSNRNPISIQLTPRGKTENWSVVKVWGIRLWLTGHDIGFLFSIQKQLVLPPPVAMGPMAASAANHKPRSTPSVPAPTQAAPSLSATDSPLGGVPIQLRPPRSRPVIYSILNLTYSFLNSTNLTNTDCWLCLDSRPPFYVGWAISGQVSRDIEGHCSWGQPPVLTIQEVTGSGLCVLGNGGTLTTFPHLSHLCNQTMTATGSSYLRPPSGAWFACTSGLTPCIHPQVLENDTLCVLVTLFPQVYYQPASSFFEIQPEQKHSRGKRDFRVSAALPTLIVGTGIEAGVGTGTAALIRGNQQFDALAQAIDFDLAQLENSTRHIRGSLDSLAEMALQNRRRLDLILLHQGGLCQALGEQCCFYANNSGIVQDSLAVVRQHLQERAKIREQNKNWYENIFNWSPWLTALITALAGPLALLLLLLTLGPYTLNRLLAFMRERLGAIRLMVLRSQYAQPPADQSEDQYVQLGPLKFQEDP